MPGAKIRVFAGRCRQCLKCVDICPEGLFVQTHPGKPPRVRRQSACIGCGHCVSICPHAAILHVDFPILEAGWDEKPRSKP